MPSCRLSGGVRSQQRTILSLLTANFTGNWRHFRIAFPHRAAARLDIPVGCGEDPMIARLVMQGIFLRLAGNGD